MAYTYLEVDLDSGEYPVYADLDLAEEYLGAAIHGASWVDLTEDTQSKALVSSTRTLDRQSWPGEKTDAAQALAWPRKNTGIEGVTDNVIPLGIVYASIELALALEEGSDVQNQQTTVERIRSFTAGSVSISNFRGIDTPTRFPQIVQELIAPYLGLSSSDFAAKATGVDAETIFPVELGFGTGGM